jgi:hypothetical protein
MASSGTCQLARGSEPRGSGSQSTYVRICRLAACEGLSLLGSELLRSCGPYDELTQEAVRRFGIVVQHPRRHVAIRSCTLTVRDH